MVRIEKIEQLVLREKKIFKFLVFYLILTLVLVFLFVTSKGWIFIETATLVILTEILITGFIKRGKPLHVNEDVQKELNNIKEIDEYNELRKEYIKNKDNTILTSIIVYSIGSGILLFFKKFDIAYIILSVVGLLILYFSAYLMFRYKIDKITIILLQRRKVIREMKKEERKKRRLKIKKIKLKRKKRKQSS